MREIKLDNAYAEGCPSCKYCDEYIPVIDEIIIGANKSTKGHTNPLKDPSINIYVVCAKFKECPHVKQYYNTIANCSFKHYK